MKKNLRATVKKYSLSVFIVVLSTLLMGTVLSFGSASALPLPDRSLRIGSIDPGATTSHAFTFSYGTTSTSVGSVMFEYCTSPLAQITCDAPPGMDASGAILSDQSGEVGFFVLNGQTNRIILTRAPAQPPLINPSAYTFDNIVNPTGQYKTFYVRITTYASLDGSGVPIDFSAVANSTAGKVFISSEVPPYLKFCVGIALGNDCSSADESVVDLGTLTPNIASQGESQMIAATNAEFGIAIAVYGSTMTSGNNTISALSTPTLSAPGNAQFGMNLRENSNPDIGQEPSGAGIANPTGPYNIPNRFTFTSGDVVATSPSVTDTRKFTSSYIVNIPPTQPPGVYTSTLTYICTATF